MNLQKISVDASLEMPVVSDTKISGYLGMMIGNLKMNKFMNYIVTIFILATKHMI